MSHRCVAQLPVRRLPLRRARCLPPRGLVTSSIEPSLHASMERPETIVLAESSLYSNSNNSTSSSWKKSFESFYPQQGLHFSTIDIFQSSTADESLTSVKSLQQTFASDLSHLAAHTVLIARGPIQCLAAQFFLESLPLSGLVMVDPLLLPDDGRVKKQIVASSESLSADKRWESSLHDFMALLQGNTPDMYKHAGKIVDGNATHPLLLRDIPRDFSSVDAELSFIESLSQNNHSHKLLLEPGIVPMLIFYSSGVDNDYEDYYRICAERTAAFHTCAGSSDHFDQVSVSKVPIQGGSGGTDVDHLMEQIYDWYDNVVA